MSPVASRRMVTTMPGSAIPSLGGSSPTTALISRSMNLLHSCLPCASDGGCVFVGVRIGDAGGEQESAGCPVPGVAARGPAVRSRPRVVVAMSVPFVAREFGSAVPYLTTRLRPRCGWWLSRAALDALNRASGMHRWAW